MTKFAQNNPFLFTVYIISIMHTHTHTRIHTVSHTQCHTLTLLSFVTGAVGGILAVLLLLVIIAVSITTVHLLRRKRKRGTYLKIDR